MKIRLLLISLVIVTSIIGFLSFYIMYNLPEPYTLHLDGGNCSIGLPDIAGDYKVSPDNKNPLNWGDSKSCAIEDCKAYNIYQRLIHSEKRCVV